MFCGKICKIKKDKKKKKARFFSQDAIAWRTKDFEKKKVKRKIKNVRLGKNHVRRGKNKMFKRQNRLPRGIEFYNSFFSTPNFILKVKKNGLTVNRFGIVVSKKIDKRAVERNKIKRMFRKTLMDLNKEMASGHDILFIVGPGIINKTAEQVSFAIKEVLEKKAFIL